IFLHLKDSGAHQNLDVALFPQRNREKQNTQTEKHGAFERSSSKTRSSRQAQDQVHERKQQQGLLGPKERNQCESSKNGASDASSRVMTVRVRNGRFNWPARIAKNLHHNREESSRKKGGQEKHLNSRDKKIPKLL